MLEYHAAYYRDDESGWFAAEVIDFPGALSQGKTLRSARRNLRDALRLMAECLVERGKPLPTPKLRAMAKNADYQETIRLKTSFLAETSP
jgi:predicted RNase H-like HicB family nuclease